MNLVSITEFKKRVWKTGGPTAQTIRGGVGSRYPGFKDGHQYWIDWDAWVDQTGQAMRDQAASKADVKSLEKRRADIESKISNTELRELGLA